MSPMISPGGDDDRNIEASEKARQNSEEGGNSAQSDGKRDAVPTHATKSYGESSRCRWIQDGQISHCLRHPTPIPYTGKKFPNSLQTLR